MPLMSEENCEILLCPHTSLFWLDERLQSTMWHFYCT